jgi:Tol biopolymer transport system component
MNADGTSKRRVTHSNQLNGSPVWSPDGQKILFERYYGGSRMELYTMNVDGTTKQKIARIRTRTDLAGFWCACPAWSPDGTKIAYEAIVGKNPAIFVMNADGRERTQITHRTRTREENPDWSPDGTQIAFYSERFGNAEIVVMNPDGTKQRRITHDPCTTAARAGSLCRRLRRRLSSVPPATARVAVGPRSSPQGRRGPSWSGLDAPVLGGRRPVRVMAWSVSPRWERRGERLSRPSAATRRT